MITGAVGQGRGGTEQVRDTQMRSSPAMGHREGRKLGLARAYDRRARRGAHAKGYCAKACNGACRSRRGHEEEARRPG
jgi:hypothetical protein